jgi:hypothetical protein
MLLSIVRGEKIGAAIRPLALLLLCLSGNTCDVGERPPTKGGDSLPGPFQRASRASDEYAAVLPEEEGNGGSTTGWEPDVATKGKLHEGIIPEREGMEE